MSNRRVIKQILEANGYEVIVYDQSGDIAIEPVRAWALHDEQWGNETISRISPLIHDGQRGGLCFPDDFQGITIHCTRVQGSDKPSMKEIKYAIDREVKQKKSTI